jgi:plastocyanin/mono/diheme cytochrome c family protein
MTDPSGREPEQRLPATRPEEGPSAVERFSAPPSAHEVELTPERSARIVRASGDARFIGFLAVVVVALFVVFYYVYEVTGFGFLSAAGLPSTPRMETEFDQQQVTAVERGYNIYQANCARCHGVDGEGGIGPTLHSQEKLYQHLNPTYLAAMMTVGGRFACGDPASIMPVWSNQGFPPGPLNYKQIEDLIEFIRSPSSMTFVVRDPELFEPEIDPATGEEKTFQGWVDETYKPAPGATPYPNCWKDSFATPSAAPGASGSPAASAGASQAPSGTTLQLSAQNIAYDKTELEAPADTAFQIEFANNDAGVPHNVAIKDASGTEVFKGEIFNGVATKTYDVPALAAGTYTFVCTVHPNMTGTLTVK